MRSWDPHIVVLIAAEQRRAQQEEQGRALLPAGTVRLLQAGRRLWSRVTGG